MTELLHAPYEPGLSDDADPVVSGSRLRSAENVRFRKYGRAEKRFGVQTMRTNGNGFPHFLAEFNGHKVFAAGPLFWRTNSPTGTLYTSSTLAHSVLAPHRSEPIARTDRGVSISYCDVATANGVFCFVWGDGTYVYYSLKTDGNSIPKTVQLTTGAKPRVIAVGSTFVIVWTDAGITLRSYTVSSLDFTTSGPQTLASGIDSQQFDISAYSSTQWLLAYQNTNIQIRTNLMTGISTVSDFVNVTSATTATGIAVDKRISTEVYVAWTDGNGVYYQAFDENLSSTSVVTTIDSTVQSKSQPVLGSISGSVWVLWSQFLATPNATYTLKRQRINSAGTLLGPQLDAYNFRLASKPFVVGNSLVIWATTDNASATVTGWDLQRGLFALEVSEQSTAEPHVLLHDAPSLSTVYGGSDFVPAVVQRSDGIWCVPAIRVLRTASDFSDVDNLGLDALLFTDATLSQDNALRAHSLAQKALHIAGGVLEEYTGQMYESGFFRYPVVHSTTATYTGGGIQNGSYQYCWVYEHFDPQGRRARSAPSDPVSVTFSPSGVTHKVVFSVSTYALGRGRLGALTAGADQISPVVAHLYRTTNGGTTFYRVTQNTVGAVSGAPMAWGGFSGPTFQYTDATSDTNLTSSEILYTEGGVLGNVLPPACRFSAEGGNRLWLGGLFNRTEVVCSKLMVPDEPAQFTGFATFSIYFPHDVTGLIWGDGLLVAFTEDGIYSVSGDGPNDQGQGTFDLPQRIPSDVGCINHFSIVEIPQGWLFQSKRGIYLLPRGFGQPVFVGAPVQETLKSYPTVRSAVRVVEPGSNTLGESTVRFVVANSSGTSRVLVLNTQTLRWESVDNYGESIGVAGIWDDRFTYSVPTLSSGEGFRQESYSNFGDQTAWVSTRLRTGDMRPFGLLGRGKTYKVQVVGEIRGPANLHAVATFDGVSGTALTVVGKSGYAGERFHHQFNLPTHQCNSIDLDVWDRPYSGQTGAGEGLVFHGLTIEHDGQPGLRRVPGGDSS